MTCLTFLIVDNTVFPYHNKFQSHKEHSIRFFAKITYRITLRDTLRASLQKLLMRIDPEDEEVTPVLRKVKDKEGKPT